MRFTSSPSFNLGFIGLLLGALMLGSPLAGQNTRGIAPIIVNTTADELNSDGDCSLREAVEAMETSTTVDQCLFNAGNSTILVPTGTYNFLAAIELSVPMTIAKLSIRGGGPLKVIFDGGSTSRIFEISSDVTLRNLTLQNGYSSSVGGALTISGPPPIRGGSQPAVVLDTVEVLNSRAETGGGGIFATSVTLEITRSRIATNVVEAPGVRGSSGLMMGGGYVGDAELTMTDSIVAYNSVLATGSSIAAGGGLTILGSNNSLSRVTVHGNVVESDGAAATAAGGGIYVAGPENLEATNIVVSQNRATGRNDGVAYAGGIGADEASVRGVPTPVMALLSSTVFANRATTSEGGVAGPVIVGSSIVVGNTAPTEANCNSEGDITSWGFNLLELGDPDCPSSPTDQTVEAPNFYLGMLAFNGGAVPTHRLLPGSPAINGLDAEIRQGDRPNKGSFASCPETDARGFSRAEGGSLCDIGSYEVTEDIAVAQTISAPIVAGAPLAYSFEVSNGGYHTSTVDIFHAPPAGLSVCSWTCSASPGSACTPGPLAGSVSDMASIAGDGTLTYSVSCSTAASLSGDLTFTSSATPPMGSDPDTTNNTDTDLVATTSVADLSLQPVAPPFGVDLGVPLVLQMTISNLGPSDASGVDLYEDLLDTGSVSSMTCENSSGVRENDATRGTTRGSNVLCSWDSIPAGATYDIELTLSVGTPSLGTFSYGFSVATSGASDIEGNNDAVLGSVVVDLLMTDGFESGDTTRWARQVPQL